MYCKESRRTDEQGGWGDRTQQPGGFGMVDIQPYVLKMEIPVGIRTSYLKHVISEHTGLPTQALTVLGKSLSNVTLLNLGVGGQQIEVV